MKTKFKVEYRNRIISKDFIGMNKEASRQLHVPFHHPSSVVEVYRRQTPRMRRRTRVHEEIEYQMMLHRGLPYRKAHRIALKYEKSKGDINTILNRINHNDQIRNYMANRKRSI